MTAAMWWLATVGAHSRAMADRDQVQGFVAPGYEGVVDAFARNLAERGEVGAAFAAVRDGTPVVDLWGGTARPGTGEPWRSDTLPRIYSGTKALVAVCLLILVERGRLDPQAPIATYWPEFAARDKEHITVAEVVSHRARMPGLQAPVTAEDLLDPVQVAKLLAGQAPETDPRAALVYHALTYGWLCAELIRRLDGRGTGRFFAEEVAGPLGLDLWIGLPAAYSDRVAAVVHAPDFGAAAVPGDALAAVALANPPLFGADPLPWNSPRWHHAEIPGAGAIGTPRAVARLFGCLARGGEIDGVRLLSPDTIALGAEELARGRDPFFDSPLAFGFGFQVQGESRDLGPVRDAFGHSGAGGSMHGAWPGVRVGFSYAMNRLLDADPDPRRKALLDALHAAVSAG